MKKILIALMMCATLFAQTASYPSSVAGDSQLKIAKNNLQTNLRSGIGASDTTITVGDASRITAGMLLTIDTEIVNVTAVSGNTLTVTRGYDNTTAATHRNNAPVYGYVVAWHHNVLAAEVKAIQTALGANLTNIPNTNGMVVPALYDFTPQTPGVSLTNSILNSVTLTPCPQGVNGTDTTHSLYISGGTGTAETVIIAGGTCTSGAASGTIIFVPANDHSGSWTIRSATQGIQEAVNASATGSYIYLTVGTYTLYGNITNGTKAPFFICSPGVVFAGSGTAPSPRITPSGTNRTWTFSGAGAFGGGSHQFIHDAEYTFPVYRLQNSQSGSKLFDFAALANDAAYTKPYMTKSGRFSASGTSGVITAVSGTFPTSMADGSLRFIVLNGRPYPITTYNTSTSLTVFPYPPYQTNGTWAVEDYSTYQHTWYGGVNDERASSFETWTNGFFALGRPRSAARLSSQWDPLQGICTVSGSTVTRASGDFFTSALVGRTMKIDGTTYEVATYVDSSHITLTTSPSISGYVEWIEYTLGQPLPMHLGIGGTGSIMDTFRSKIKITPTGTVFGNNVANATTAAVSDALHITGTDPYPLVVGSSPLVMYSMRDGEVVLSVTSNVATATIYNSAYHRPLSSATTVPHSMVVSQPFTIAGATTSALNGDYTVASVSASGCNVSGEYCKFTFATSGVADGTYGCPSGICEIDLTLTSNASYLALGYDQTNGYGTIQSFDRQTATVKPTRIISPIIILPTSCSGLPSGSLRNNAGTVVVCP